MREFLALVRHVGVGSYCIFILSLILYSAENECCWWVSKLLQTKSLNKLCSVMNFFGEPLHAQNSCCLIKQHYMKVKQQTLFTIYKKSISETNIQQSICNLNDFTTYVTIYCPNKTKKRYFYFSKLGFN